jgi:hypothetical protein
VLTLLSDASDYGANIEVSKIIDEPVFDKNNDQLKS